MPTLTDVERQWYINQLGITDAQAATMSEADLSTAVRLAAQSTLPRAESGGRRFFTPGRWYDSNGPSPSTGVAPPLNELFVTPFWVPKSCRFDRIAVNCAVITATSVFRMGIYKSTSDDMPGDLVADYGVADLGTSTGIKEITIDQVLTPGLYWLAGVLQVLAGAQVRGYLAPFYAEISLESSLGSGGAARTGYYRSGVSGALPTPFGAAAAAGGNAPRITLRAGNL
jgi:hypothetical protein